MESSLARRVDRRPDNRGQVALIVAALLLGAWGLTHGVDAGGSSAMRLGYALGAGLGWASLVWAVLTFGFLRRSNPGMAGPAFLVLLVVSVGANLMSGAVAHDEARTQGRVLTGQLRQVLAGVAEGRPVDATPMARGDAGAIEQVLKTYANASIADQKAYQDELAAAGLAQVLDPAVLARDPKLTQARARVVRIRAVVEKYRRLPAQRVEEARVAAMASSLSYDGKRSFMEGFEKGKRKNLAQTDQVWALEAAVVDEYDAALRVLETAEGAWTVQDGKFVFNREADLRAFDGHVQKAQQLASEEEALTSKARAEARAQLDGLDARLGAR